MTETNSENETKPLCPQWREMLIDGGLGEPLSTSAADWRFCAVGEALGLTDLKYENREIGEALQETDETLHQLAHEFTDDVNDEDYQYALITLDEIEKYIRESGGAPAAVLKSLKDYLAATRPQLT